MESTYRQPSNVKRRRKCGFRARMKTRGGRKVLNNRRRVGRYALCHQRKKRRV